MHYYCTYPHHFQSMTMPLIGKFSSLNLRAMPRNSCIDVTDSQ